MSQESLLLLLTLFIGLVAAGQLMQAIALLLLQQRARALQEQVAEFAPRARALLDNAQQTLEKSRTQIAEITTKANDVLDATRAQLGRVDGLVSDIAGRVKSQMERAELVLDDTLGRVHETVTVLHNGVMRPLREINGVSAGIRAAIGYMLKGGRPSVAQATQDEEMFI